MVDDMVMRSMYLRPLEDAQLRQLALNLNVTKSDLIRSAIRIKLSEWLGDNKGEKALKDVQEGLRDVTLQAQVKRAGPKLVTVKPTAATSVKIAAKKAAAPKTPKKVVAAPRTTKSASQASPRRPDAKAARAAAQAR